MWLVFATRIEPGQPAHSCSLTRLYNVGWPTSCFHLDNPKDENEQFQKWKVDHLRNSAGYGLPKEILFQNIPS